MVQAPLYCLSLHASYLCRNSGACCTSGWPIPVETALRVRLDEALDTGRLRMPGGVGAAFVDEGEMPPGIAGLLRIDGQGACACYDRERRRCAIHAQLGHDLLPASCQHFPRVCLIDRAGTFVTLSHYCPTALALLFRDDIPLTIVGAPPGLASMPLEGLDARDALPPLLRPGMLSDREGYRRWERHVVAWLAEDVPVENAMARVIHFTECLRQWEPRQGPLDEAIDEASCREPDPVPGRRTLLRASSLVLDGLVRESVPTALATPRVLPGVAGIYERLVAPAWSGFAGPVRRFLAARAFANWCAYQGHGLRTVVCSLVAALSVVRVEAARHCHRAGRTLDAALLGEAFRSADLLLLHLASREELAARLSEIEEAPVEEMTEAL